MDFPTVGVLPLTCTSIDFVAGEVGGGMNPTPLVEALSTPYGEDLCSVCYLSWDRERSDYALQQPRLNKGALPYIQRNGGEVRCTHAHVDLDLHTWKGSKTKLKWTEPLAEEFAAKLAEMYDSGLAWAGEWSALYLTPHGAHIIWVYSHHVDTQHHEGYLRGLVQEFTLHGLPLDPGCCDWTRLMRLPRIRRDTYRTEALPFFTCEVTKKSFNPESLPFVSTREFEDDCLSLDPKWNGLPIPTPEQAKQVRTGAWFRDAKKRSKGRTYVYCTFDDGPIAEYGNRDTTIHSKVGEAVAVLFYLEGTEPYHIYGLFHDAIERLDGDQDWANILWRAICMYWQKEDAKAVVSAEKRSEDEQDATDTVAAILYNVRSWCDHPELHQGDEAAWQWLRQRLIAMVATTCYVMGRDGYYSRHGVPLQLLPVAIRDMGMEGLIPLNEMRGSSVSAVSSQALLGRYATSIPMNHCVGAPGLEGTIVESLGDYDKQKLKIALYSLRTDIHSQYNKSVDEWIQQFAGENYADLVHWIGHALDFTGQPICALSIQGWPGIGKKMLVAGLCECVDGSQHAAPDSELTGQFQSAILSTPFVNVNEGWSGVGPRSQVDVADRFRQFVGGDTITVNQKFMAPIHINNPCRLILTANNDLVVQQVFGHRDLSVQDRQALIMRILHLECPKDATLWLAKRGGIKFTRGWVRGDGGQASALIVAKHFLWIHENRKESASGDGRLLVEGNMHPSLQRAMRFRSGVAPQVVETLLKMISQARAPHGLVILEDKGKAYVTVQGVLDFYRVENVGQKMHAKHIRGPLNAFNLRGSNSRPYSFMTDGGKPAPRRRWIELDLEPMLDEAIDVGLPCKKLTRLVDRAATIRDTWLSGSGGNIIHIPTA